MAGHSPHLTSSMERKGKERREERVGEEAGGQGSERRPQNLMNYLLYLISPDSHVTWVRYKGRGHCENMRRGRSSPGNQLKPITGPEEEVNTINCLRPFSSPATNLQCFRTLTRNPIYAKFLMAPVFTFSDFISIQATL